MYGYDMGWGWHWMGLLGMLLFWLVVIVTAVVALKYLAGGGSRSTHEPTVNRSAARAILEERYARGEIERDEYLRKREDLERK